MDEQGFLYVADWYRCEVRRWRVGDSQGTLIAGGNGKGNRLNQLNGPRQSLCRSEPFCLCARFGAIIG